MLLTWPTEFVGASEYIYSADNNEKLVNFSEKSFIYKVIKVSIKRQRQLYNIELCLKSRLILYNSLKRENLNRFTML